MKKIKVGILGYGNLGRAIEEILANDAKFELVAVFSHRNIETKYGKMERVENLKKYKNKIKILFLCGGSSSTLMADAKEGLVHFNTIDAFDTHKLIKRHISSCKKIAKQNKKIAFCSLGWDPGLFSMMRVLYASLGEKVYTTWGRGVSQGHSEAVRRIENVKNAIQYTIPNKALVAKLKRGEDIIFDNLHRRECFVVADEKNRNQIKQKIVKMPYYFAGYKTSVKFISEQELLKHNKLFHSGEVFTLGNTFSFSLRTDSNPNLTARIMVAYSFVLIDFLKQHRYGAYSILDLPLKNLVKNSIELL